MGVADGLLVNIPVLGMNRLTWGVTVMDSPCMAVNVISKHLSSLIRQIRSGVYLKCDSTGEAQAKLVMGEFIILEKLRKEIHVKSYR